ncbi:MAG TPA: GNAT family N-acetyltransferase, partial [Streptosporangiaceae bacterium]
MSGRANATRRNRERLRDGEGICAAIGGRLLGDKEANPGLGWDTAVVTCYPEPAIVVISPAADEARCALWAYFDDVASRHYGRPATEDEIAAAMREDPSEDLTPPHGLLLVAHEDGNVLGCAGLRLLPGQIAEVTRVFVAPAARRRGLGSRLLNCLEDHARGRRVSTLRLDTRRDLVEARQLYARHGYREVRPFNNGQ